MTHHSLSVPTDAAGPLLSRQEYDALSDELERLRATHRATLAETMRHARQFGSLGHEDDRLAALEDTAVDRSRISRLERILGAATVVAPADDGAVGLGSVVWVRYGDGREAEYEVVGRRTGAGTRAEVTPGSPVGAALLGARPGDTVQVALPAGGTHELEVLAVDAPVVD